MNKEEIEVEISAIKVSESTLKARREYLQSQLSESPLLEHGDYGIINEACYGDKKFVVIEQSSLDGSPKAFFADQSGQVRVNEPGNSQNYLKLGNIFADLSAMSENVEKVTINSCRRLELVIVDKKYIAFCVDDESVCIPIKALFDNKIMAFLATAKRLATAKGGK